MSRHLGNVVEPMAVLNSRGADAVRWFFAASGSPWGPRRIGPAALDEIVAGVLLTYWNLASCLTLYANASSPAWTPEQPAPAQAQRSALDRWLLGEVGRCVRDVTRAMEEFDSATAGRAIAGLIGDLSHWYVRRSRRRLRAGAATRDGAAAFATLHEALVTVTKLMAPVAPFLTDHVWTAIRPAGEPESVHLASWPVSSPAGSEILMDQMALLRRLVNLGRSARASGGTGTRQPLSRALVAAPGFRGLPAELHDLLAAELNVRAVESLDSVTRMPASGWGLASANGEAVALDLTVTASLRAEGLAREVIRRIQRARKADGLTVTDRVRVRWDAPGRELSSALARHAGLIADEVLAVAVEPLEGAPSPDHGHDAPGHAGGTDTGTGVAGDWHEHVDEALGLRFWLALTRS
jgi:isoleucyl-tRNA synthetase